MNRVILITGASSGIGLAVGNRLVELGFNVIGTSRITKPESAKFELTQLDVTQENSITQCVEYVINKYGAIDTLINNAGCTLLGTAEETDIERVREQFESNFFGMVRMTQAVLPQMRQRGRGQIINLSSLLGFAAIPFSSAYSASKFAVEGYSEALFHELLPLGIHVSVVRPGMVKTSLFMNGGEVKNVIQDYAPWYSVAMAEITTHAQRGIDVEGAAQQIADLCGLKNPPLIRQIGADAKLVGRLKRFLPNRVFNKIWHKEFGLTRVTLSV